MQQSCSHGSVGGPGVTDGNVLHSGPIPNPPRSLSSTLAPRSGSRIIIGDWRSFLPPENLLQDRSVEPESGLRKYVHRFAQGGTSRKWPNLHVNHHTETKKATKEQCPTRQKVLRRQGSDSGETNSLANSTSPTPSSEGHSTRWRASAASQHAAARQVKATRCGRSPTASVGGDTSSSFPMSCCP